jgi:hypothetical protein
LIYEVNPGFDRFVARAGVDEGLLKNDMGRERAMDPHVVFKVAIDLPTDVEFAVADENGEDFRALAAVRHSVPTSQAGPLVRLFLTEPLETGGRFVRVRAASLGKIPAGHPAAGARAWLFADELLANPNGSSFCE